MELLQECRIDPLAGLVAQPKIVAERLDHVIRRDPDVSRPLLEHLQHGLQHADDRAVRTVLSLVEATQPVEVAKQLVGAVYDMNDHAWRTIRAGYSNESGGG